MRVELIRVEKPEAEKSDQSKITIGVLRIDGKYFCMTAEPPQRENVEGGDSCIPAGVYTCKRFTSEKHPHTFQIMDVPNRTSILFHMGNTDEDTAGCIILGNACSQYVLVNSKLTFMQFLARTKDVDEFELTVKEV